ncbi:MAG TPA: helix-turn-helix transcriptional regulator [Steroidobacteraceae bacterium]|nr:helix-turn-helix transcriptional regulator [Steroidobacteraceae bacterium]
MADRRARQASGGFALRLRQVIEAHGSANSIARTIERSEGAVRKWLRGESEPNVTDLRALCEHTNTSIEWLVTGRGRPDGAPVSLQESAPPAYGPAAGGKPLNYALLESIMDALDAQITVESIPLSSAKRSMLVVTLYDLFQESQQVDREALARLVRLAR